MLWRPRIKNKKNCDVNQILPSQRRFSQLQVSVSPNAFLWGGKFWWPWREVLNDSHVPYDILSWWDPVHMERPLQFSFKACEYGLFELPDWFFLSRVILQLPLQDCCFWIKTKYMGKRCEEAQLLATNSWIILLKEA